MGEAEESFPVTAKIELSQDLLRNKWVPPASPKRGELIRYAGELFQDDFRDLFNRVTADAIFIMNNGNRDVQDIYAKLTEMLAEMDAHLKPADERAATFDEGYLKGLLEELIHDFENYCNVHA